MPPVLPKHHLRFFTPSMNARVWKSLAAFIVVWNIHAVSGEYDFDIGEFEKKRFTVTSNIDPAIGITKINKAALLYPLRNPGTGGRRYLDWYRIAGETMARYERSWFSAHAAAGGSITCNRYAKTFDSEIVLNEGFFRMSRDAPSLGVWIGKRTFKWGKGYSYNPTAFAARPKIVEDIDAGIEGYWSISTEYIKSFSFPLSTVALTLAVLPVHGDWNVGYLPEDGGAAVLHSYMLVYNTDIDAVCFVNDDRQVKAGAGFSRNIFTNWEIHGEGAYIPDVSWTRITRSASTGVLEGDAYNALLGTRYLTEFGTTAILEYIHRGEGHSKSDMAVYYDVLRSLTPSSDPGTLQKVKNISTRHYERQFTMREYLYCKLTHPEPFGVLYTTPALYGLVNLKDGSFSTGGEISYSRFKNGIITAKYTGLWGDPESEFGIKPNQHRWEMRLKIFI